MMDGIGCDEGTDMHALPRHHQMMSWSDADGITVDDRMLILSVVPRNVNGLGGMAPIGADHPCDRLVVVRLPDGRRVESSVTWTSDGGAGVFDAPLIGVQWIADVDLVWDVAPECVMDDGVRRKHVVESVLDVPVEFDDDEACREAVWGFLVSAVDGIVG